MLCSVKVDAKIYPACPVAVAYGACPVKCDSSCGVSKLLHGKHISSGACPVAYEVKCDLPCRSRAIQQGAYFIGTLRPYDAMTQ